MLSSSGAGRVDGEDTLKCSLRSNNPAFDCAKVARRFGGGGWESNAGFVLKNASIGTILKNASVAMNPVDFEQVAGNPYSAAVMQQEVLISAARTFTASLKTHPSATAAVVNVSTDLKDVAEKVKEANPDCDYVLAWFANMRTEKMDAHLLSIKEGFNVLELAQANGGKDGDPQHASFSVEGDLIVPLLA